MSEMVRLEDLSYAYPESERYVLRDVSLTIRAGECHCIGGPTGSGKTSLALAIKGLLPQGRVSGSITYGQADRTPGGIGIVLQNPETQILMQSVGAETAFGLENLCADPRSMPRMVKTALLQVGLEKPLDAETALLSMGEKYRLLLAAQLVMAPKLLIMDEPAAQLDPDGLIRLLAIVRQLKKSGIAIVVCENDIGILHQVVDTFWNLNSEGRLLPGAFRATETTIPVRPSTRYRGAGPQDHAVTVSDMAAQKTDGSPLWSGVSFALPQGGRATLYGRNGSGKTTLLRCLLGFTRPVRGMVRIFGENPAPSTLRGRVGCLFQNPQRQLFEATVFEEVAFALQRSRESAKGIQDKVAETLAICRIEHLAGYSPHMLSYGQKHLVALASVLAAGPRLLFLDDPFAGLDPGRAGHILEVLTRLNEDQGTTLLLTSHNPGSLGPWADLSLHLEGGGLVSH